MRGLVPIRARVLLALSRPGTHTQDSIALAYGGKRADASRALRQLANDGLVSKGELIWAGSSKRRIRTYEVTEAGRAEADHIRRGAGP